MPRKAIPRDPRATKASLNKGNRQQATRKGAPPATDAACIKRELVEQIALLTENNQALKSKHKARLKTLRNRHEVKLLADAGKNVELTNKLENEIMELREACDVKDIHIGELEANVRELERDNKDLLNQLTQSQANIQKIAENWEDHRNNGSYAGRKEERSPIRDSVDLIISQGREAVDGRVTTVRPRLRTPAKLKPRPSGW